jgi:hypothetical protein
MMCLEFWLTLYIPKSRSCNTFILSPTAFAGQDGLIITSRSIKKITAVCAEYKRANDRHIGKQDGGICVDFKVQFRRKAPR